MSIPIHPRYPRNRKKILVLLPKKISVVAKSVFCDYLLKLIKLTRGRIQLAGLEVFWRGKIGVGGIDTDRSISVVLADTTDILVPMYR